VASVPPSNAFWATVTVAVNGAPEIVADPLAVPPNE
jgi:hypothetical protein